MDKTTEPAYSSRFVHALQFAGHIHAGQRRKGAGVPYLAHLMAVSAMVWDYGGTETEAIGALLHDSAEDCGGHAMLEQVRSTFGGEVADIVAGCTDTFENPKPAWRPRKESYITHLRTASDSVRVVACADKLHNLTCTIRDLSGKPGQEYWQRFSVGRDEQIWYYGGCLDAFRQGRQPAMFQEFEIAFGQFRELAV